jgi:toxin CcdB
VVLQSDQTSAIATRVVAPLVSPRTIRFLERLLPKVKVNGSDFVIAMPDMGAVPARALPPAIANLEDYRYQIIGAVDLIFSGI